MSQEEGIGAGDDEAVAAVDIGVHGGGGDAEYSEGDVRFLTDGRYMVDGGNDLGMFDLPNEAEAGGQIIRTNEDGINAGYLNDLGDVLYSDDMFSLDNDSGMFVGGGQIFFEVQAVAVSPANADASRAEGGVFGVTDDFLRFFGRIYHGGDDTSSAGIERFFDVKLFAGGETYQASCVRTGSLQDVLDVDGGHGAVFGIDEEPIETKAG